MIDFDKIFKITNFGSNYCSIDYNWTYIWQIPEFAKMESIEQNPKWHGEGNVKNHTELVCKHALSLVNNCDWFDTKDYNIVNDIFYFKKDSDDFYNIKVFLTAALFHDIGKIATTSIGKDGNYHSYGHEMVGEKMTRSLLWGTDIKFREDVCALIRYHMEPLSIFETKSYLEKIVKIGNNIPSWKLLISLKKCDLEASEQEDSVLKQKDRTVLTELSDIVCGMNIYNGIEWYSPFKNKNHLYINYLNTVRPPKQKINVFFMMGLPGAGKDTFINTNLFIEDSDNKTYIYSIDGNRMNKIKKEHTIVLSRDNIRHELGFCTEDTKLCGNEEQEKAVTKAFNEQLLKAAEAKKNIVINCLNLKKQYRDDVIKQLSKYNVIVTIIYIEANSLDLNISRRNGQIKESIIIDYTKKIDWPDYYEYDNMYIFMNS